MSRLLASLVLFVFLLAMSTVLDRGPASATEAMATQYAPSCSLSETGARCFSKILLRSNGTTVTGGARGSGWTATDIEAAYGIKNDVSGGGVGRTVAIVDAFDDPKAESDMAKYRSAYNLPPCTTSNGCFRKINQMGNTSPLPKPNKGWAQEISLDLDMVSAACPHCDILLVEAKYSSSNPCTFDPDLMTAERTAFAEFPDSVSNSWGSCEKPVETSYDSKMQPLSPKTVVLASAGDGGYGTAWPAADGNVISVGGTTLKKTSANSRGWSETVWNGTGSGCSTYEPQPSWQQGLVQGCTKRIMNDLAAVATNVAVYDSYKNPGWVTMGGTSASAPLIAGMITLAGGYVNSPSQLYQNARLHPAAFNDITTGNNGKCRIAILCHAKTGWDGPTGIGSPAGVAAFASGSNLVVGNNAAVGNGPIQTYDLTSGSVINSFVPDGAQVPSSNGRAIAISGNEIYYTELTNGFGSSDGIHVAPFNNGAGGHDLRVLPNPSPSWGIQDLTFAGGSLYAFTGYDSGPLEVWKLDPATGAVIAAPTTITGPDSGADGFTVLPNGDYLINDGDASCTYREYDPGSGQTVGLSPITLAGSQCTGVETDGSSLYFQVNFDSFIKTTMDGTLISITTVGNNLVEDIALP